MSRNRIRLVDGRIASRIAFSLRELFFFRGIILLLAYSSIFVASLFVAYQLRFDFSLPSVYFFLYLENLIWVVPLKLILMFAFGQFGGLLSYFRLPDLYRIFFALCITSLFILYLWHTVDSSRCPPRSVILADFGISLLAVVGLRVILRVTRERYLSGDITAPKKLENVAIIGAGDGGSAIAADLLGRRGLGMRPVVFLDDDRSKWRRQIHGIPVVESPDNLDLVRDRYGIRRVIIAMPSAPVPRVREIVRQATALSLRVDIIPSLAEFTSGRAQANRIRPVDIEDLLGREPVKLNSEEITMMLSDRVVLVTGAGGSIGAELSRQIAACRPKRLLLLDQSELHIFRLEEQLLEEGYANVVVPIVANILDAEQVERILQRFRPGIIFHAAAHKHVPMMERQAAEAFRNNTMGTVILADLAVKCSVGAFVLISTDKAVNPVSVMGATKRLAEIYLQARQCWESHQTRFMAVRFGNVLGSSGSVIPVFRRQIANGGPIRITHPEMTRYFMTITEAVGLVLQCGTLGRGGEVYMLNMGTPIKILDLAHQMIELSGLRPEIDIAIEFIGPRPGEKLSEEIRHRSELHAATAHSKVLRFISDPPAYNEVRALLDALMSDLSTLENAQVKQRLAKAVPEYSPFIE